MSMGNRIAMFGLLLALLVTIVMVGYTVKQEIDTLNNQNVWLTESLTDLQARSVEDYNTIFDLQSQVESLTVEVDRLSIENDTLKNENESLILKVAAKEQVRQAAKVRTTAYKAAPAPATGETADLIRNLAAERGYSESQQNKLVELARRESTLNPNAVSKSGTYKGLFQLGTMAPSDWNDPVSNTNAAMDYIDGRYGSIDAALAHSDAKNWY